MLAQTALPVDRSTLLLPKCWAVGQNSKESSGPKWLYMGLHSLRMQGELCTKDHNTCLTKAQTKAQHSCTLLRKTSYGAQCNHRRQLHCAKKCSYVQQSQTNPGLWQTQLFSARHEAGTAAGLVSAVSRSAQGSASSQDVLLGDAVHIACRQSKATARRKHGQISAHHLFEYAC
jgi:hypothetical protein